MKIRYIFYVFILLLYCLSAAGSYAAVIDPSFEYSTIETDHFSIHYHQGLEDIALKAASIAEEVHPVLVKEFKWEPQEKTQIVLIDNMDFANGMATAIPYNTIYLNMIPPAIDTTIGEYDDWLKMLIIHEYTHILTLDPVRGYSKVMRRIFGKTLPIDNILSLLIFIAAAPPNILLPRWRSEGIATWAETEYSTAGRGRSTFYEMIIRMAVAKNVIPSIDKINGEIPDWPAGIAPYMFGMKLHKYIVDKYGKDYLGELNLKHAGRFPYFINGAFNRSIRHGYISLYNEMIIELKREEQKRIEILKKTPFTRFNRLETDGQILSNPRYSPDGLRIAYNRIDPHEHPTIMIVGRDGMYAKEIVRRLPSDGAITWSPDSSSIYFCQAEVKDGFNVYQDLYSYNTKNEKLRRLTHGLRIKDPDMLHDISGGVKTFAVIVNNRGSQNLAILNSPDKDDYTLNIITDYKLKRVSRPKWSPDGAHIAYSVTDNNRNTSIHIYNTKDRSDRILFEDDFDIAFPVWSGDGKYIIYTSDHTGVYNLFAYSLKDAKRYQISHILGGVFQPDLSGDRKEIVFSRYDSDGFKISTMEYDPDKWKSRAGPFITPYWNEENGGRAGHAASVPALGSSKNISKPKPYTSTNTLAPRFWLPTLAGDHKGIAAGAFTAGQDVLGYNSYIATIYSGLKSKEIYSYASYANNYFYPTFMLQASSTPVVYSDLSKKKDYYERNSSLMLNASVPINYLESRYSFNLGYHLQKQEALSDLTNDKFKGIKVFQGRRDNIQAGIQFDNILKYPYSISYEEGRVLSMNYRYYSSHTGSDLDTREYLAFYSEYLRIPFLGPERHQVVYLNLKGAVSDGEQPTQQSFHLGGHGGVVPQSDYPVRGYPSGAFAGRYIATGTLEYRAPLWYILRGWNTKPFFWDRLHMSVFTDIGEVWSENMAFSSDRLKIGSGFEIRFDLTLGYSLKLTPAIGFEHGFNDGGETNVYLTIYSDL